MIGHPTPGAMDSNRPTLKHIPVKLKNPGDRIKVQQVFRVKKQVPYKGPGLWILEGSRR